jgi:hypothetical protein
MDVPLCPEGMRSRCVIERQQNVGMWMVHDGVLLFVIVALTPRRQLRHTLTAQRLPCVIWRGANGTGLYPQGVFYGVPASWYGAHSGETAENSRCDTFSLVYNPAAADL